MQPTNKPSWVGNSLSFTISALTATAPKFCCWSSAVAAMSGGVSYLAWVYPMRPYLFAVAFVSLGYSFYSVYGLEKNNRNNCTSCKSDKPTFFQSKLWVWTIAILLLTSFLNSYFIND